jgi:hypothetical protein
MYNKILKKSCNLLIFTIVLILLSQFATAAAKPIVGYVYKHDNTTAINASVQVYANTTSLAALECRTVPLVYTGADGGFSTNLNNLKRVDNGNDCSGNWVTGDVIWIEADGSTVSPTQNNGTSIWENISSGTGLQTLQNNATLGQGPDITDPVVTLISPQNNSVSITGNITFEYNVTDGSNVSSCTLQINNTINQTDNSITIDVQQNFSINSMGDGILNWGINCTDGSENHNSSSILLSNVSRRGILDTILLTPLTSLRVTQYELFEFSIQVNCTYGTCGDVNASLDPISFAIPPQETSFIAKVKALFTEIFTVKYGNLITGFAAGSLVPTTPTLPFYTNTTNPVNASDFSCLENMQSGSSCNITWFVNASGNLHNVSEFYAYVNSTNHPNITAETAHINITIAEFVNPAVFNVTPLENTTYNVSNVFAIGANVTDNNAPHLVKANVTFPNGTVQQLTLSNSTSHIDIFNITFTAPALTGRYNVTIISNDTFNNTNDTQTSFFNVDDILPPDITTILPINSSVFNVSNTIEIAVNVTDDVHPDHVLANITLPNGTVQQLQLTNASAHINKFNVSYTIPGITGLFNITIIANDTSNNINDTSATNFTVNDVDSLVIVVLRCTPDPTNISVATTCNATITDDVSVHTVLANVTLPNGTVFAQTPSASGSIYNFTFATTTIAGVFNVTWFANDTSSNTKTAEDNFTVNDILPPEVTTIIPINSSVFNPSNIIEIAANVTDDVQTDYVIANITLPNATVQQLRLTNTSTHINKFNASYTVPTIAGLFNVTIIANDTSNNINNTLTTNFTVNDILPPDVTNILPINSSVFNVSNTIEIAANVTDDVQIDYVIANITLPNGTIQQLQLTNASTHLNKFNVSYTIPAITGLFNVTIIANDTSNNLNNTLTTNFTVNDITKPSVTPTTCVPDPINTSEGIVCSATITDDVAISIVLANVTLTNGTVYSQSPTNVGFTYNFTYIPSATGNHDVVWFANDTSNNINDTGVDNFTAIDTEKPKVVELVPGTNLTINVSNVIEISANITDNINTSSVTVNITYPNGTIQQLTLTQTSTGGIKFNASFTAPGLPGAYQILYIAQDVNNNINDTEIANFNVEDIRAPDATTVLPDAKSVFNVSNIIQISANVSDDAQIDIVIANISLPNGTVQKLQLTNASTHINKFNATYTIPPITGLFNITIIANDTSSNLNNTLTTNFTVNDINTTTIRNVTCIPSSADSGQTVLCNATITDDVAISIVQANVTLPNGTIYSQTISNSGSIYNFTFTATILPGTYNVSWFANDTSSNENTGFTNFSVVDEGPPSVFSLKPIAATVINVSNAIEIAANVTDSNNVDSVFVNITLPNSTIIRVVMTNNSNHIDKFNTTYTIPGIIGRINISIIANDSQGNINSTSTTFVTVNDITTPQVVLITPPENQTFLFSSTSDLVVNVSDDVETSIVFTNITFPNGTIQKILLISSNAPKYNNTFVAPELPGRYNISFFANDTSNNINNTISSYFIIASLDADNDNIEDALDTLLGNETEVNVTGTTIQNITIGGKLSNGTFNKTETVVIYERTKPLINFTFNFTNSKLDLRNITIVKNSTSLLVNMQNQLINDQRKNLYLENNEFDKICVKDASITSISNISVHCNETDETNFTPCLGFSLGITLNNITCYDSDGILRFENMKHSGIRAAQSTSQAASQVSSSTGGGGTSGPGKLREIEITKQQCKPAKTCTEWITETCNSNNNQLRLCTEVNKDCKITERKEEKPCTCEPSWECTPKSDCQNEIQTNICVNSCNNNTREETVSCQEARKEEPTKLEEQKGVEKTESFLLTKLILVLLLLIIILILIRLDKTNFTLKENQKKQGPSNLDIDTTTEQMDLVLKQTIRLLDLRKMYEARIMYKSAVKIYKSLPTKYQTKYYSRLKSLFTLLRKKE